MVRRGAVAGGVLAQRVVAVGGVGDSAGDGASARVVGVVLLGGRAAAAVEHHAGRLAVRSEAAGGGLGKPVGVGLLGVGAAGLAVLGALNGALAGVEDGVHVPGARSEEDGLVEVGAVGAGRVLEGLLGDAAGGAGVVSAGVDGGDITVRVELEVEVAGSADVLVAQLGAGGTLIGGDNSEVVVVHVGCEGGLSGEDAENGEEKSGLAEHGCVFSC